MVVVSKTQLEKQLITEKQQISEGRLEDENPLDESKGFRALCEACRLGDIKRCMELINEGANINARDAFDYTPLILRTANPRRLNLTTIRPRMTNEEGKDIMSNVWTDRSCEVKTSSIKTMMMAGSLTAPFHITYELLCSLGRSEWLIEHSKASLCGHYEVVQLLLESGALCQRDTFQGERCLYNALNDRIRNLLLGYDYSKTTHPLQPFASHINSLLSRERPKTWDINLSFSSKSFRLHKLILAARSPYFKRKLAPTPGTKSLKLVGHIVPQALEIAIRFIYLGEVPVDIGPSSGSGTSDRDVPAAIEKLSRMLEMEGLWEGILEGGDRRIARQRHADEIVKCRDQVERWYRENVLKHKIVIEESKANDVRWDRENSIFADVLLRADEDVLGGHQEYGDESCKPRVEDDQEGQIQDELVMPRSQSPRRQSNGIPIGPVSRSSHSPSRTRRTGKSVLFPAHRAMLIRSEFFMAMFSSSFREAQTTDYLQIIPVDCSPEVLEIVLDFLYTEQAEIPLNLALDVLLAADMLLLDRLKIKAAVVISTLGNVRKSSPRQSSNQNNGHERDPEDTEVINIYDVIRAGWLTRMQRLDEFGAKYLASRLEDYIDEDEFADLIKESAARIKQRQETDSIELLDDIRFYLSERFRLRFEDAGLEEILDDEEAIKNNTIQDHTQKPASVEESSKSEVATDAFNSTSKKTAPSDRPARGNEPVGHVRTLAGDIAGDEFDADAINYRILLRKIDDLLERLKLDA